MGDSERMSNFAGADIGILKRMGGWGGGGGALRISDEGGPTIVVGDMPENFES